MIISSILLILITLATFIYCLQRMEELPTNEGVLGWMFAATFCIFVGAVSTLGIPLPLPETTGGITIFGLAFVILLLIGLGLNKLYNAYKDSLYPYS